MKTVYILGALLAGLIFIWFYTGGYKNADLRGIFLAPPAPVGSGEAYGPGEEPGTIEAGTIQGGTYDPYEETPEAI